MSEAMPAPAGPMIPTPEGWGWKPDTPDFRDYRLAQRRPMRSEAQLPRILDARKGLPARRWNQHTIGCCVSQAVARIAMQTRTLAGEKRVAMPSKPFIYWQARLREGTVKIDAGCQIRSAIEAVAKEGMPANSLWAEEYDEEDLSDYHSWEFGARSRWVRKPTARVYAAGLERQALERIRLRTREEIMNCLAEGFAFAGGIMIHDSFYGPDGMPRTEIPMPAPGDRPLGGHAITFKLLDQETNLLEADNSWGEDVQDKGCLRIPLDYLLNPELAGDFWSLRAVEGAKR